MSSETVLFDMRRPDGPVGPCVLRLAADPEAYAVFPVYDMERQYRVMGLVASADEGAGAGGAAVGEPTRSRWAPPFFVMERVSGRVPPDLMPYTYGGNWLFDASTAEREALERSTLEVLAGLHRVSAEEASFLEPAVSRREPPLRRHVQQQRAYYGWVVRGRPRSPLIERAFARLEQLWPREEGETVLSWGDARVGNIIYRGFEPAAVLDWEMASLGPRELDLAWTGLPAPLLPGPHRELGTARAAGLPGPGADLRPLCHAHRPHSP